jgi:OmpA-OmpF porin, OOP family
MYRVELGLGSVETMKCNPWRWLWGLLPLAVLALIVNFLERTRIESDLTNRTKDAIAKAGMDWASINFTKGGRDGLISGDAVEETERDKIHDVASSVWGVRTVDNKAKLLDKVDKYSWSVSRLDKEIRIKGLAPSDTDRKAIVKMAEASFPGYQIKHDMKLARGVPDKQAWLAGVGYSFKQLEQLTKGQADLDNLALTLSGDAATTATYKSAKAALGQIPKGVSLKHERIAAPNIKPFVWDAKYDGKQVVLTGYAPTEKARDQVAQDAKQRFIGKTIVDRTEIGGGAPKDWERAADVAITQLSKLELGEAALKDVDLTVQGTAAEETTRDVVATAMKTALPQAFRGSEKVTFRTARVAAVSPFLTRAVYSGEQIVLLGNVPSEEARTAILAYARTQFPGTRIADRLNVAAGYPDTWQACTQAGLVALKALGNGHFELKDKAYMFSGTTKDEALSRSVPAGLSSGAGPACTGKTAIELTTVAAAPAPAVVAAAPPPPAAAPVSRDDCQKLLNDVVRTGVILFERAKADLNPESFPTLDKLSEVANRCPKARIEIGGHTDARGSAELNQRLSEQRAQSVAAYLARRGLDDNRLFPVGYGPSRPVAPNDTDEERAKNRRIEFVVRPN